MPHAASAGRQAEAAAAGIIRAFGVPTAIRTRICSLGRSYSIH